MALSLVVTIPLAQRYSQAKVQGVTANHKGKPGELAVSVKNSAIYPQLFAVFGSMMLSWTTGYRRHG